MTGRQRNNRGLGGGGGEDPEDHHTHTMREHELDADQDPETALTMRRLTARPVINFNRIAYGARSIHLSPQIREYIGEMLARGPWMMQLANDTRPTNGYQTTAYADDMVRVIPILRTEFRVGRWNRPNASMIYIIEESSGHIRWIQRSTTPTTPEDTPTTSSYAGRFTNEATDEFRNLERLDSSSAHVDMYHDTTSNSTTYQSSDSEEPPGLVSICFQFK